MKTVVLGDIHGRTIWKDIIAKEQPDQVIFLGDYVSTHDNITNEQQIDNFKEIIKYKDEHPDSTILLRGNHDMQHLGYYWAACSGLFPRVQEVMMTLKDIYLSHTQWIYINDDVIFSHAGISKDWLAKHKLKLEDINGLEPDERFGFCQDDRWDVFGTSPTQPPTWIRPGTLVDVMIPGYSQVVGHTTVRECVNIKDLDRPDLPGDLWLCDALGNNSYLIINNKTFEERKL